MRRRRLLGVALLLALVVPSSPTGAAPALPQGAGQRGEVARGTGVDLVPVSSWRYRGGTDLEFATVRGRDYAVAASEGEQGGVRLFDLTADPARPPLVGYLPCTVSQNDVQVRGTTVFMAVDDAVTRTDCFSTLGALPALGVLAIDISHPRRPRPVGFVGIPLGAHNTTLHPSGAWLYVSDSELNPTVTSVTTSGATSQTGRIEVLDVRDPRRMRHVRTLGLPTGLSSHDISFNRSGTRAYSAALTETLVLDTSDPAAPTVLTTIVDPLINIHHGADPTPDGTHLYITDEQAGAVANGVCNVGGVWVYDITNELVPVKTGFYPFSPASSLTATTNSGVLTCTAHVLDYGPTNVTFSNAGYAAGVRIVDIRHRVGIPTERASFTPLDADTWSAKQYKDPRYLYANDLARGFDVYRWVPGRGPVDTRTAMERRYDVRRLGRTTFLRGAWCAQPRV